MSQVREERLNEEVKKTLSAIIFDMKDPRIPAMTSVTAVEVSQDMKHAKVHISVYDDAEAMKEAIKTLNHASGFIAHEVGQRMQIRRIPSFKFVADESIAYGARIASIINSLHQDDDENT